jgi:hypothetical protein
MTDLETLTLSFPDKHQSIGVRVAQDTDPSLIALTLTQSQLNKPLSQRILSVFLKNRSEKESEQNDLITSPHALIIFNGGTAELEPALQKKLTVILQDGLAQIVVEEQITLLTGGTQAGIFALLGEGLGKWGRSAPCIGVCVENLVRWKAPLVKMAKDKLIPLEPHHSHFVLVDGKKWGDELNTMYTLGEHLSKNCPTINIYAGGGQICKREMQTAIAQGRKMILLAGSGRLTDEVLKAHHGEEVDDEEIKEIAEKGDIVALNMSDGPEALRQLIKKLIHNQ